MGFDINEYFAVLAGTNSLLSYKGKVTIQVVSSLLDEVERKLTELDEEPRIRKKVYNILVECLQNLYHHVEDVALPGEILEEGNMAILVIKKVDNQYKITTGNFVRVKRIKPLKSKIDKINSLTQDEIKDMYKFILNHQRLNVKGGGGLGLLDIARRTGNKFDYTFHVIDERYNFFNLDVYVS
ncbi:MAG: SiaB family protein kinase [Bacteroidota bacterium]|nr:SiaB family protein kinase [Bacteroidota bacterium]